MNNATEPSNDKPTYAELLEINLALQNSLKKVECRCDQITKQYDQLQQQLKQLLRHRFGSKSERYVDSLHPQQLLFDDVQSREQKTSSEDSTVKIAAHERKKKSKTKQPKITKTEVIKVDENLRHCPCGQCKVVIGYESKIVIHYVPPEYECIEQKREVVACKKGCSGSLVCAALPRCVLPKSKASDSLLAHITISKVLDRQPLYHLEKQFKRRFNVQISRQTMARWMIELGVVVQPLVNLLKDKVIEYDIAAIDATSLQVLKEPGRPAKRKSYCYCIRGGPPHQDVVLYEYNARDHKKFVKDWFAGFKGYIQADADPFFDELASQDDIIMSYCNVHARRYFEAITKVHPGDGLAAHAMEQYQAIYKIERQAKDGALSSDQRLTLRQKETKPIMDAMHEWLIECYPLVLPKSTLGKAMNYAIKHWDGLVQFMQDGRLEADNNLTEQEIKYFVISRKNFLFADSIDGAKALCNHFSLVRTAQKHGLEPYQYYVKLLQSLPQCQTVEDYEKLLPWNIDLRTQG